jgi:hypothetical protein
MVGYIEEVGTFALMINMYVLIKSTTSAVIRNVVINEIRDFRNSSFLSILTAPYDTPSRFVLARKSKKWHASARRSTPFWT